MNFKNGYFWENVNHGYYDSKIGGFRRHSSKHIPKGASDILGVLNGKFVALEVKTEKEFNWCMNNIPKIEGKSLGAMSKKQKHLAMQYKFIQSVKDKGGVAGFCCDWKTVLDVIGDLI